jgi:carbon-monoxide dehydrogenase medium subunit
MTAYARPDTDHGLWDVLDRYEHPRPLAGGTDLIVQIRDSRLAPDCVVDVKGLPRFVAVARGEDEIRIGAATSCRNIVKALADDPRMQGPLDVARLIGSSQIQNRASFGGNVCNASPAADAVPLLIAMEARYLLTSRAGSRQVAAEDFATGPARTVLGPAELLEAIILPNPDRRTGDCYLRMTPRTEMDIAIAGAGVRLRFDASGRCSAARVALGGVAPKVVLAPEAADVLVGSDLGTEALGDFVSAVRRSVEPIDDIRGTRSYRRHVIGILARRAALVARDRAFEALSEEG